MFGAKIETHPKRLMVKICPLAISTLLRVPTSTRFLPLSVDLNEAKRKGEREGGRERKREKERESEMTEVTEWGKRNLEEVSLTKRGKEKSP